MLQEKVYRAVSGWLMVMVLIATTIGGFTPAISTYLIHATGNKAAPGLWMGLAAICGLVATLVLYRSPEARNQYKTA